MRNTHCIHFLFSTIAYEDALTVGLIFHNVSYTDWIFQNPKVAYFDQWLGWAVGTKKASMWSTMVLRYYETMILPLYT